MRGQSSPTWLPWQIEFVATNPSCGIVSRDVPGSLEQNQIET